MTPAPLRIGLTGGIGSGKSTVAALLARHGASVIDTDRIARQLSAPGGAAIDALRAAFGAESIDAHGGLDRPRMRQQMTADAGVRARLEAILHPMIQAEAERQALATPAAPAQVFDIPLLVESGHWLKRLDRVLVIDCSPETQTERVVRRSGWTPSAVGDVIALQAGRAERRSVADAVIFNDGIGPDALAEAVAALWKRWMPAAK